MKKINILILIIIFQILFPKYSIGQIIASKSYCNKMWDIPPIGQRTNVWCYAATTEMILKYYGIEKSQNQIAAEIFSKPQYFYDSVVCNDCIDSLCVPLPNSKIYLRKWIKLFEDSGLPSTKYYREQNIKFSVIKNASDSCKPVILLAYIGSEMVHALVIAGYIEMTNCNDVMLLIKDPLAACEGCEFFMIYNKITRKFNWDRNKVYSITSPDKYSVKLIIPSK